MGIFSSKNIKKALIIKNDGEQTSKIEHRVFSLQVFCCNHEADIRIALHASKSKANAVVKDILMFLIYSYFTRVITRICVKILRNS